MKTYNIVSNCCVGARFYEQINCAFLNPFMWCAISLKDFIKLIKEWDVIHFEQIKSELVEGSHGEGGGKCGQLILENGIRLKFIHHIYNPEFKTKKVPRHYDRTQYNTMGSDILEYLEQKWQERLTRMGDTKPIFVYFDDSKSGNINVDEIFHLRTRYKTIVISAKNYSYWNSNQFHYIPKRSASTVDGARDVIKFLKENPKWFIY